jgi:acid stress-induced BolA-like protein IbaG/YrbA
VEWQSEVYYKAAVERIQEALHLHTHGYYVVAMSLSGLRSSACCVHIACCKTRPLMSATICGSCGKARCWQTLIASSIEEKVKSLLTKHFDENEIIFEDNPDGRVSGIIVSEKFEDMDDLQRQKIIWGLLRNEISKVERWQIIGFIAATPAEYKCLLVPDF